MSPSRTPVPAVALPGGAISPATSASAPIAAGTTNESRQDPSSARNPITGVPTIQAAACEPTTQPIAHSTRSPLK